MDQTSACNALDASGMHHRQETDLGPGEENIGSFQLATRGNALTQTLDVIRSADRVLRLILLSERSNGKIKVTERREDALNTRSDAFIPIHTISDPSSSNSFPVETVTGYGAHVQVFDLLQRKDAHAFQKACTNYNVASFKRNVRFTVTSRERGLVRRFTSAEQDLGYGEIQLWQWPNTQMPAEEKLSPSQSFSRVSSALAESIGLSKWSVVSRTSSSRRLASSVVTVMGSEGKEVVVAATLPPPLLVAFLKQGEIKGSEVMYTMWKIDVSELKSFHADHSTGTRLKRKDGKSFKIQKLSVTEDKLLHWNLCALMDPLHIAHSDKRNSQVEVVRCSHVDLTFPTDEERERFELQVELVVMRRALDICHVASAPNLADARSDASRFSITSTVVPSHDSDLHGGNQLAIDPLQPDTRPITLSPTDKPMDSSSGVDLGNSDTNPSLPPSRSSGILRLPIRSISRPKSSPSISQESKLPCPTNVTGFWSDLESKVVGSGSSTGSGDAAIVNSTDDNPHNNEPEDTRMTPEQLSSDEKYDEEDESEDDNESWYSDDTSAMAPIFGFQPAHSYTVYTNGPGSQHNPTGGSANINTIDLGRNGPEELRPVNRAQNLKRRRNDDQEDQDPGENKSLKNTVKNDKLLACPYAKRNPQRYPKCQIKRFPDTNRLKEHLYRTHSIVRCPRCGEVLEDSIALRLHLQEAVACTPQPSDMWSNSEGFTDYQEKLLKKKKRTGKSEAGKWKDIYKILFPHDSECSIPDPFYDLNIAAGEAARRHARETLLQYHEHQNDRTTELLQSEISVMDRNGMTPFNQMQMDWVIQTVLNIQNSIHGEYQSSMDTGNQVEVITSTQFANNASLRAFPEGQVNANSTVSGADGGPPGPSEAHHLLEFMLPFDDSSLLSNDRYGPVYSDPTNSGALGFDFFPLDIPNPRYPSTFPTESKGRNLEGNDNS